MKKQLSELEKLQKYVNILEDLNGKKKYNNYDSLIMDLLVEFGIKIDRQILNELYEPTLEEDIEDRRIIYNNVC